jgi:hypothetical protein
LAALYRHRDGLYHPGPLTVGPWSPDAQHGGPVAALLAGAVEDAGDDAAQGTARDMQVVRLTVELTRPAPLTPLSVESEVIRPGRNVQLVEATLRADGREVARARALRIRRQPVDVPVDRSGPPVPPPHQVPAKDADVARTAFADAMELRFVKGGWDDVGPVTMWTRLVVPVVEGRSTSPLQRTAAAADFGNGVSRLLDFSTHTFINPDLTVALARVPEGDWILFDVVSRYSGEGYGQAESQIFDTAGPVGRAVQSLIVNRR